MGSENTDETTEHARDCPKVNVFCTLSANKAYRSLFSAEQSITSTAHLNVMEMWLMPQLEKDRNNTFFSLQDGAPLHSNRNVTEFLKNRYPGDGLSEVDQ
jgi:hypothetical protein